MNPKQLKELSEILESKYYTDELKMPKTKTEGLANFVQMAINAIEEGDIREALIKLVDLKNDIGSAYVCK